MKSLTPYLAERRNWDDFLSEFWKYNLYLLSPPPGSYIQDAW
jgi:hypothetical protein